jgi:hypothetical protein
VNEIFPAAEFFFRRQGSVISSGVEEYILFMVSDARGDRGIIVSAGVKSMFRREFICRQRIFLIAV